MACRINSVVWVVVSLGLVTKAWADGRPSTQNALYNRIASHKSQCTEREVLHDHVAPPLVNVKTRGAVGNGTADDTAALQRVITHAPDGSTILFPAGIYFSGTLRVVNRNHLTFLCRQGAIIKRNPASPAEPNPGNVLWLDIDTSTDITVDGCQYDMNGKAQFGGLAVINSSRIVIRNNRVFDSAPPDSYTGDNYGIVGRLGTTPSTDIHISDNILESATLEFNLGERVAIENNALLNSPSNGIVWASLHKTNKALDYLITHNHIINAKGVALGVVYDGAASGTQVKRVNIIDNTITFANTSTDTRAGILVGHATLAETDTGSIWRNITIARNQITWNTSATAGIYKSLIQVGRSDNASSLIENVLVAENTINGGHPSSAVRYPERGIYTHRLTTAVVRDNVVRYTQKGIEDRSAQNELVNVLDNTIASVGCEGIIVNGSYTPRGGVVVGNLIRHSGLDAGATCEALSLTQGISRLTVTGNTIDSTEAANGIREVADTSTGNLLVKNWIMAPAESEEKLRLEWERVE